MENQTTITKDIKFNDFLKNPLFILISIPTAVLTVCNIIYGLREVDYLIHNLLLFQSIEWIVSNISGMFIYFPAFLVYLAYTIFFILMFFSDKTKLPLSVPFIIFKVGVVVSVVFEIINFIFNAVLLAVYDIEQIFYLAKSIPDTIFDIITPLLSLFLITAIEKSIKSNMIRKNYVSFFIASSIVSLVFVVQKLIVYFSVSFSPYLIFLISEAVFLLLFAIIAYKYLIFNKIKAVYDEIEDDISE